MTFTPPKFSVLMANTRNLEIRFKTKLGCYSINDPEAKTDSTSPQQNSLEILLARTQEVIECETGRDTACDVFKKLVLELREVKKNGDEEQIKYATMFLLGALLHRYFRILKEYDESNKWLYFFSPRDVRNCRLFIAIRSALKLDKEMSADFRKDDLNVLDVETTVMALLSFRDNMLLMNEKKIPRYKNYPHLEQDVNFQKYLQHIIDEQSQRGPEILKQFKAINFLKSLVIHVEEEQKKIEQSLIEWSDILSAKYTDFMQLDINIIENHIQEHVKSEYLCEKILDLLYTDFVKSKLNTFTHNTFLEAMKIANTVSSTYTMIGGYSLLLKTKGTESLTFILQQALGIEKKPSELNPVHMLTCVQMLKNFLENNPGINIDCTFFGERKEMNKEIALIEEMLGREVTEVVKAEPEISPALI